VLMAEREVSTSAVGLGRRLDLGLVVSRMAKIVRTSNIERKLLFVSALSMSASCHQQTSVSGVRMPSLAPWRCREVSPSQHHLLGRHRSPEKIPPRQLLRPSG
jgi:hypothetical protein